MIAFIFPGQASQFVGMGREWAEADKRAASFFERANAALKRDLRQICFEGPEEQLVDTRNQQPAIYTVSCIAADMLQKQGLEPSFVAGHSIGEYAALYSAGVFDFESGIRLVQERANAMAGAAENHPGKMAAVIRLDPRVIESTCGQIAQSENGSLSVAGYNSPEQTVISGQSNLIEKAMEVLKERGAKRVIPLSVSGAFHSDLMEEAAAKLRTVVANVDLHSPAIPFVSNNTGRPVEDPETIREHLSNQLTSPVHWTDTLAWLKEQGCMAFVETGPGKVLTGLAAKFDPDFPCAHLTDFNSIAETAKRLKGLAGQMGAPE